MDVGRGGKGAVVGRAPRGADRRGSRERRLHQAGKGGLDNQRVPELAGEHGFQGGGMAPHQVQLGWLPGGGENGRGQQVPGGDSPLAGIEAGGRDARGRHPAASLGAHSAVPANSAVPDTDKLRPTKVVVPSELVTTVSWPGVARSRRPTSWSTVSSRCRASS